MKAILFFSALMLVFSVSAKAQLENANRNLVKNGEFELYIDCPEARGQFNSLYDWDVPTLGTPDFYHDCSGEDAGSVAVPRNDMGVQRAHSGGGYAGFHAYYNNDAVSNNYRSYLRAKLMTPLKPGATYCVKMFLSVSEQSVYAVPDIQATFSRDRRNFGTAGPMIAPDKTRLIMLHDTTHLKDPTIWVQLCNFYVAVGKEEYLYIGNMRTDDETPKMIGPSYMQDVPEKSAYYYIDDVEVIEMMPGEVCACQQVDYDEVPDLLTDAATPTNEVRRQLQTSDDFGSLTEDISSTPLTEDITPQTTLQEAPTTVVQLEKPDPTQAEPAVPEPAVPEPPAIPEQFDLAGDLFLPGKSEFAPTAEVELQKILAALNGVEGIKIIINGHMAEDGGDETEYRNLSRNRARNVAFYLIDKGIDPSRVFYFGYGWRKPIADNSTPEGRKQNERVEVKIVQ